MGKTPARNGERPKIPPMKRIQLFPESVETFTPLRDVIPQAIRDHFDSIGAKRG